MLRQVKLLIIPLIIALTSITSLASNNNIEDNKQEVAYTEPIDEEHSEHGHAASPYSVIPFFLLLIMIASGPLFYEHFWHKNYPKIAISLATIVILYYIFFLDNTHSPIHAFFEYLQFISLLTALYVASGGIMIDIDKDGKPLLNTILLFAGAIIANIIGTTGASMLLIRPFIRLNKKRIQPYHIVFFIMMVSNIGGCLTPIGDPPLFLGFLKGVPFTWTITHNFFPWLLAIGLFCIIFYFYDKKMGKLNPLFMEEYRERTNRVSMKGGKNFLWLFIVILAVFLDPGKISWFPAIIQTADGNFSINTLNGLTSIEKEGATVFSFIREIIMLTIAILSYKTANQTALRGNEFNFAPIKEVAFIFIGIFGTMMPALELVAAFAASPTGKSLINHDTLYWGTGLLSGFLDNAPTYLNFFTAAISSQGGDINKVSNVVDFAYGSPIYLDSVLQLVAISVSAVFFGAMTYIGNGPNFMVKSIAEQIGIEMPSFFAYIIKYSIPILLPVLLVIWLVFFAFAG